MNRVVDIHDEDTETSTGVRPSRSERVISRLEERGLLLVVGAIARNNHAFLEEVVSDCRIAHVARARHQSWAVLMSEPYRLSSVFVGTLFECDHSTVLAGVKKYAASLGGKS